MDIVADLCFIFVYKVMRTWKKIFGPHDEKPTKEV
jgi:hypothetical protein